MSELRTKQINVKNCPKCSGRSKVLDSRTNVEGGLRRRRVCSVCKFRYTTMEFIIGDPLIPTKKEAVLRAGLLELGRLVIHTLREARVSHTDD